MFLRPLYASNIFHNSASVMKDIHLNNQYACVVLCAEVTLLTKVHINTLPYA